MKTKTLLFVFLFAVALVCSAQTNLGPGPFGVTNAPVVTTNVPVHVLPVVQQPQDVLSQYLVMIIPVVVPLLIAGLKKWLPTVPPAWLPILAMGLGAVSDTILQASGVQTGGTIKGALLGAAGVGVRELIDQLKQSMPKPPPPPPAVVPPPVAEPPKPA